MKFKGQLRYTDSTKTKVKFYFKKNGANAETKNMDVAKLPAVLAKKLEQQPGGIGDELPITDNNQIDLVELMQTPIPVRNVQNHHGAFQNQPQTTRRILSVEGKSVVLTDGPVRAEKINVTDSSLGLQKGNAVSNANSLIPLTQFGAEVDGLAKQAPNINLNPYNFVEFAGIAPWTEEKADLTHAYPMEGRCSGVVEYVMTALTPVFVPGGYPFATKRKDDDRQDQEPGMGPETENIRQQPRHFFRMHDAPDDSRSHHHPADWIGDPPKAQGICRYAIPGSSIKGVVRSEIEALSNSRLGVLLDDEFFGMPIPYRRRSFSAGVVAEFDPAIKAWAVRPVRVLYMHRDDWPPPFPAPGTPQAYLVRTGVNNHDHKSYAVPPNAANPDAILTGIVRPYFGGLAVAETRKPYRGLIVEKKTDASPISLDDTTIKKYQDNLRHPHYEQHRKTPHIMSNGQPFYVPGGRSIIEGLDPGDLIYYTEEQGKITTFGKNINYLWPSSESVLGLAKAYQTPKSRDGKSDLLGLKSPLSMAERLFGFSGIHNKTGDSHPFRGLLRFETAWGPKADQFEDEKRWTKLTRATGTGSEATTGWRIELAPLTSPKTRAKARPLYLKPNGPLSGSWEDSNRQLRGRKFYWPQVDATRPGRIWKFHLKDDAHMQSQLPPPIYALKEDTEFRGRIHFRNLTEQELGALVFALEGAPGPNGYDHTLRIGKGKPRGLGNVRCKVSKIRIDPAPHTLLDGLATSAEVDKASYVIAFQTWVESLAKPTGEFWTIDYIKSYRNLHHWKEGQQIRYYPINFEQYGWLPNETVNNSKGEPSKGRPPGMKLAKDLP